jgi:hypothetical protein
MSYSERFPTYSYFTVQGWAKRHVLTRVEKCIDVDGGIFENVLLRVGGGGTRDENNGL